MVVSVDRHQVVAIGFELKFSGFILSVYPKGMGMNGPLVTKKFQFTANLGCRDSRDLTASIKLGIDQVAC